MTSNTLFRHEHEQYDNRILNNREKKTQRERRRERGLTRNIALGIKLYDTCSINSCHRTFIEKIFNKYEEYTY